MSAWGNICRICSSPADHEIFAKIPTYLHANRNEFLNWQKPINKLIEETTGLKISSDDGLPKNICALCVSYLKHAVTFREQCINNALSFHFVLKYKELQRNKKDAVSVNTAAIQNAKENLLIEEDDLMYSNQRELDAVNFLANSTAVKQQQDKVSKALFDQYNSYDDLSSQLHYLQKLFHKQNNKSEQINTRKRKTVQQSPRNCSNIIKNNNNNSRSNNNCNNNKPNKNNKYSLQFVEQDNYGYNDHDNDCYNRNNHDSITPISSDEMLEENAATAMSHVLTDRDIFAYKERNFIEDDIIDMEELQDSIAVNIPENSQERKCEACLNRFMFHETYQEHKDSCIHLKLAQFVEEVNQLILLKSKEISTHEFIRRMIFSIRKICEWLISHYGDTLLPDLPQNSKKVITPNTETTTAASAAGKKIAFSKLKFVNDKKTGDESNDKKAVAFDAFSENKIKYQQQKQQQSQQFNVNVLALGGNTSRDAEDNNPFLKNKIGGIINVNNNILIEIERLESRQRALKMTSPLPNNQYNNGTNDCSSVADINASITNFSLLDDIKERKNRNDQNILASSTPTSTPTTITNLLGIDINAAINPSPNIDNSLTRPSNRLELNVTARCQPCGLAFETLMAFEVHNALYHNCIKKEIT